MEKQGKGKIIIVPCSGIGKVQGLMAREAAYQAVEEIGRDKAETLCLARLVTGDKDALGAVRNNPCIAVDGCPKLCACKNLELAQAKISKSVRVVDAFKRHRGAKPGDATSLTDEGWAITGEIAREVADDATGGNGASSGE
jgi:uncharacterized metal-binding protein